MELEVKESDHKLITRTVQFIVWLVGNLEVAAVLTMASRITAQARFLLSCVSLHFISHLG